MTAQQIWTQIVEHAPVPDVHVRIGSDTSAGRVALNRNCGSAGHRATLPSPPGI